MAGPTESGRTGDEYERDPRLPPLPARAQASPASARTTAHRTRAPRGIKNLRIMNTSSSSLSCAVTTGARSGHEQHLARRAPAFQGPMGLRGVLQGELVFHAHRELAVADPPED